MGMLRRRYGGREPRFGHHVQPMDGRRMLGHRRMMNRQVIDEYCRLRAMTFDDRPHGFALAAPVADDLVPDAVQGELIDAPGMGFVAQVGEDDDVGDLSNFAQRLDGTGNDCLAMHFLAKELLEQRPDLIGCDQFAGASVGHGFAEIPSFEGETDAVCLAQPGVEMRHHMKQNLIAISDEQGPVHRSSSRRAAISASGS